MSCAEDLLVNCGPMAEASGFYSLVDDEFQDPEDEEEQLSRSPEELESELLLSARNGNLSQVTRILDLHKMNSEALTINCKGKQKANLGWTAIHLSAYFGHASVTAALIEYGVDINVQNDSGDTPLHKAAYTGREDMVTLLITHGADVSIINCEGHQAKHVARSESIRKLIEATQNYETKKTENDFLRHSREGHVDALSAMLKAHKPHNISCTDRFGNSALHCAAYRGRKEAAILLIQNGIDTSLRNAKGQTAEELARDSQMKKLLSVSPLKTLQKEIPRFEGPLLKRAGVFGWKPVWVVLEKGVLSIFRNRADASTGAKRRGFRYLDEASVQAPKNGVHLINLRLGDSSTIVFSVEMDTSVHINRQKWITALQEHISYSKQWSQEGATVSDEENDEQEVMPLGSIQDVIQNAQAHQQLMERHVSTVTDRIDHVTSQTGKETPEITLAQLQTELQQLKESSREMIDAMNHAVTILSQQDKVRNVQLHQETEKCRVLQDALRVLAEEHHHLEQSIRSPCDSMIDSGDDEEEFHDCIESSFPGTSLHVPNAGVTNGCSSKSSRSVWGGSTLGS